MQTLRPYTLLIYLSDTNTAIFRKITHTVNGEVSLGYLDFCSNALTVQD